MIRSLVLQGAALALLASPAQAFFLPSGEEQIMAVSVATGQPEPLDITDLSAVADGARAFNACFATPLSLAMLSETYKVYPEAHPAEAPFWFGCFDAAQLDKDLEKGDAVAFLAQPDIVTGVDRVFAVYPDGRAFAWQQLNENAEK